MGRYIRLLGFVAGLTIAISLAALSQGEAAPNVSYAYQSTASLPVGSLVSLEQNQARTVTPANSSNADQLIGVVVRPSDSSLAVGVSQTSVQVATNGTAQTLVSTLGGNIKIGDQIGVSPYSGVGIKALAGSRIVGLAQASFSSSSPNAISQQVTTKSGQTLSTRLGYIPVNIAIGTAGTSEVNAPSGLQKIAVSLTGHTVSNIRLVISLIIAIASVAILIIMIYGAIYGSILSVGRNPLAKFVVFRALWTVIAMALLVAAVGSLSIYFLLK